MMFGPDVPRVDLFWLKVGGGAKWIGLERIESEHKRVHRATVLLKEPGLYQIWVDGGNGMQKVQNPDQYGFVGYLGTAKEVAEVALADLRSMLAEASA